MDWYEGWVEFDGEARKTYVFCLRSMASGGAFHRAYPHANQQAFLEAVRRQKSVRGIFHRESRAQRTTYRLPLKHDQETDSAVRRPAWCLR